MPGWKLAESEHFFLLTDVHGGALLGELLQRLEAIQAVFEADFPSGQARLSPQRKRTPKAVVRVFRQPKAYFAHGGPPESAGFWSPASGELSLLAQKGNRGLQQTWATLNHEAFHQYIYFHFGGLTPHTWYGEGFGDYYGSYRFVNGRYQRPMSPFEHSELDQALLAGNYADLKAFIYWTKGEYYGNNELGLSPSLAYAQGCSLIHFLRSGEELFPEGWQSAWDQILPRYQETFAATGQPREALLTAFDGINLIALENCWKQFYLTS